MKAIYRPTSNEILVTRKKNLKKKGSTLDPKEISRGQFNWINEETSIKPREKLTILGVHKGDTIAVI